MQRQNTSSQLNHCALEIAWSRSIPVLYFSYFQPTYVFQVVFFLRAGLFLILGAGTKYIVMLDTSELIIGQFYKCLGFAKVSPKNTHLSGEILATKKPAGDPKWWFSKGILPKSP